MINAISFRFPWQKGHSSTLSLNTRFISSAHVYRLFRSEDPTASGGVFRHRFEDPREDTKPADPESGTTRPRQAAFGAKTPWYVTKFDRGGGTSAQSFSMKVSGSKITARVPS